MDRNIFSTHLSELTNDALNQIIADCRNIIESRKNERRDELIKTICDAMNELYDVAPTTELPISWRCPSCDDEDSTDVMYCLCDGRKLVPSDFKCW